MTFLRSLCCLLLLACSVQAVEVVVHSSVSETTLSTAQLRAIFTMRQTRWTDGQAIQVFVLQSDHPHHQRFSRDKLKMFPYQLDAIWSRQRYSGIGSFPMQVDSASELLLLLETTPGAIGYLPTDTLSSNLRVVTINEK
ncbi:hypothetical protein [Alishewanella sp. HL-SH05]|uniref:hypothetical protein n=1 Tax=Alishewanella sp. HL-SH05 TaxID=3461145 RepID=UPI0040430472